MWLGEKTEQSGDDIKCLLNIVIISVILGR